MVFSSLVTNFGSHLSSSQLLACISTPAAWPWKRGMGSGGQRCLEACAPYLPSGRSCVEDPGTQSMGRSQRTWACCYQCLASQRCRGGGLHWGRAGWLRPISWAPSVVPHGAPHPSSPPHGAVTVLNPTFQMERQRLARELSQATWQWMKDSDSGHSGPQRVTGTLELRHTQHELQDTREWAPQACFLLIRQGGCLK